MTLSEQFKIMFDEGDVLTTKEITEWYKSVKSGSTYVHHSNVFSTVINQFLGKGILRRIGNGKYVVGKEEVVNLPGAQPGKEMDEFDRYLKDKIKQSEEI